MSDVNQMEALGKLVKDGATEVAAQVAESTATGIAKQVSETTARATAAEVGTELRKAFSADMQQVLAKFEAAEEQVVELTATLEKANVGRARAEYDAAARLSSRTEAIQLALNKAIDGSDARMVKNETMYKVANAAVQTAGEELAAGIETLAAATDELARKAAEEAVLDLVTATDRTLKAIIDGAMATVTGWLAKAAAAEVQRQITLKDALANVDTVLAYERKSMAASRAHVTKLQARMDSRLTEFTASSAASIRAVIKEGRELFVSKANEGPFTGPHNDSTSAPETPLPPPLTWTGPWDRETAYGVASLTMFQGSTWVAISANEGTEPGVSDGNPWQLFAAAGMGGGFSALGLLRKDYVKWPVDELLYGARGGTAQGWHRAERLILDWLPGVFYYAADKVVVEPAADEFQIWDCVLEGVSGPVWDTQEQLRWRMVSGAVLSGVATGGITGDVLVKVSPDDGDAGWSSVMDSGVFT